MTITPTDPGTCGFCGRALDGHDLHFRFRFPDALAELLDRGLDPSEITGDADRDDVIRLGEHCFIRVLLSVRLEDGARVTFGTWLEVELEAVRSVAEIWSTPEYANVVLTGRLANAIPPWGDEVRGATATVTVLDVDNPPYVTTSDDASLTRVLDDEWPADIVLAALPHCGTRRRESSPRDPLPAPRRRAPALRPPRCCRRPAARSPPRCRAAVGPSSPA